MGFDILSPFDESISGLLLLQLSFCFLLRSKSGQFGSLNWILSFVSLCAFGAIVTLLCFVFPSVGYPISVASCMKKRAIISVSDNVLSTLIHFEHYEMDTTLSSVNMGIEFNI